MEKQLDLANLPKHVGIIMDGNGRWAKKRGLPRIAGHREGAKTVRMAVKTSAELGIEVLTVYAFSTENWQRPQDEVSFLMKLLAEYLVNELEELNKKGVRIKAIGDRTKLPQNVLKVLENAEKTTRNNQTLQFNLALSYGGRDEIIRAVKDLTKQVKAGTLDPEDISTNMLSSLLDTANQPDPDLIIRTSGEMRLSNFLLWQGAYSELWFTNTLWPDFTKEEYLKALMDYSNRQRRFGKA